MKNDRGLLERFSFIFLSLAAKALSASKYLSGFSRRSDGIIIPYLVIALCISLVRLQVVNGLGVTLTAPVPQ